MAISPGDTLAQHCSSAQTLVFAAPYIKADALRRILASVNVEASLTCITRWIPHDLAVGVSDVECRELVIGFGGSFRLHPSLHAKFYHLDDVVLVGSANLTLSALGWSDGPNLEILCQAGSDFDFRTFEQALLDESREVTDAEFMRWQAVSGIEAHLGRQLTEGQRRIRTWRPRTRDPIHLELSYQERDDEIASLDEQGGGASRPPCSSDSLWPFCRRSSVMDYVLPVGLALYGCRHTSQHDRRLCCRIPVASARL